MSIELPDARQLSDEALQVLRVRALRGLELGFSEVELAELLGVVDEHVGVDDRLVLVALVPAVHPGQHHLDLVVAALDELLAGQGREIEHDGTRRHRRQHQSCGKQDRKSMMISM